MNQEMAQDFYDKIAQGTKDYKETEFTLSSGEKLEGVEIHPVDKQQLGATIEKLPAAMFEAAEDADSVDEAEEMLEESDDTVGMDAVTEDTVEAFEELCKESLEHEHLAPPQMRNVVSELSFEVLFGLGTEIISLSYENTGDVEDFRVLD